MRHWTENDFVEWVYGLKTDSTHLDECAECKNRASLTLTQKLEAAQPPDVSWEFLAAQRRSIYQRMERPLHRIAPVRWAVSLATVVMAAVLSFALIHPNQKPAPLASASDAKLFSDLVSIDESNEPRAISPIHNLFE